MAADGVDLVHEDDARRRRLGLLEQVTHTRCAHAHEHLDEVRSRDREERHARLARNGPRQQCLASARRAEQQHTLGDARAEGLELLGVLEELLDLVELLDGLLGPGHVTERDLGRVGGHAFCACLAEAHDLGPTALHLVHQEDPDQDDEDERRKRDQHGPPGGATPRLDVDVRDLRGLDLGDEFVALLGQETGHVLLGDTRFGPDHAVAVLVDRDLVDLVRVQFLDELAVAQLRLVATA